MGRSYHISEYAAREVDDDGTARYTVSPCCAHCPALAQDIERDVDAGARHDCGVVFAGVQREIRLNIRAVLPE